MSELLAWLRDLLDIPAVSLDSHRSEVEGYLRDHRARVTVEELTLGGVMAAMALLDDVQELRLSPEALEMVLPGEDRVLEGCVQARVCPWPGSRPVYVGRRGPEIQVGEASLEGLAEVLEPFQSAVVICPETIV